MVSTHSSWPILYLMIIQSIFGFSSNTIDIELALTAPIHKDLLELSTLGNELASGFKLAILAANKLSKDSNISVRLNTKFKDLIKDEGLNPGKDCRIIANEVLARRNLVGVVGAFSPLCTSTFQNVTKTKGSSLSQISYGSTLQKFTNETLYPTLFTSCALDQSQAKAMADLVYHFRWKRVGVIASDDDHGRSLSSLFRHRASGHSILVSTEAFFKSSSTDMEIDNKLQLLNNAGTRVNILMASGHDVYRIMKRAASRKMTGDGWVWIGTDRVAAMRLKDDPSVNEASLGMVAVSSKVASGVILLDLMMKWFSKSKADYPGIIWSSNRPVISPYVMQVYDAVMLYHKAASDLEKERKIYSGMAIEAMRKALLERLKTIDSISSSVTTGSGDHVYFKNGTRSIPASFDILNYEDKIWNVVGSWHELSPGINIPSGKIIWPGGSKSVPTDRGTPGKPMFGIGMLAPIHPGLGALSSYGIELVSAFKVAVDLINNDKNYHVELSMKIKDEGLDGSLSCEQSAQELTGSGIAAVVGAYRSQCSISAAKVLGLNSNRIPMISYASPSDLLSDKSKYKYFFRVGPSNADEHLALLKLMGKYSFSKVGSLSSDEVSSKEIEANLLAIIETSNSTMSASRQQFAQNSNRENIRRSLSKLKASGSRVNLLSMLANDVDITYQQIKELSLAGKGHVWLATTGATTTAFKSNQELAKDMEGVIGLSSKSGDGSQYLKLLSSWLAKGPLQYPGIVHETMDRSTMPGTAQVFDAVNGIALALSDLVVANKINHATPSVTVREMLFERLKGYSSFATGYPSATGLRSMFFDSNQNGPQIYDVVNLVDSKWQTIGTYVASGSQLVLNRDPLFPGRTTTPMVGGSKTYYKVVGIFPSYPRSNEASANGHLQREAFLAAVDYVNSNKSFNVGFEGIMINEGRTDQQCINQAKNISNDVVVAVGPSRSSCCHAMGSNMTGSPLPFISYSSTSDELSNKAKFLSLFRTSAPDRWQAEALAMLIKLFQWKKVGVITETSMYGRGLSDLLVSKLNHHGVEVTAVESIQAKSLKNLSEQIKTFKSSGSAVNVIISNPEDTATIFQEAFEQGMTGKGWTWLAADGAATTTLSQSPNLQRAMQGMLGIKPKSGHGNIFEDIMLHWKRRSDSNKRLTPYLAQIFDAVLSPAVALHRLQRTRSIRDDMDMTDKRGQLINGLRQMKTADKAFTSTTGAVFTFDKNGDGVGCYDIVNLNGDRWIEVGVFEPKKLAMTKDVVWSGGSIHYPSDSQPIVDSDQSQLVSSTSSNKGLVALAVVFGIFGVLVLAFMAYIIHRVRYRHLYMQSDVASGGLFSVLYGHGHSKPNAAARSLTNPSNFKRENGELAVTRHV